MTNNKLFILAFDHRGSFRKFTDDPEVLKDLKLIVFEGFKQAVSKNSPPKDQAAVLADEELGDQVLKQAIAGGYITALPVEKSGQDLLALEYGEQFEEHVNKYRPAIVKVLVRYTLADNKILKQIGDFAKKTGYKYMIEVLTDAPGQADVVVNSISQMQEFGIEPDIWKLEGMNESKDYEAVVRQAQSNGRSNVGVVILGRGSDDQAVLRWLEAGKAAPGVIGFAIGRTIFSEPLKNFVAGKISRVQAVEQISENYQKFYRAFIT